MISGSGFLAKVQDSFNTLSRFVKDLRAGARIDPKVYSLGMDLAQLGLVVIGLFEPTPVADGLNAGISLYRRDWWGAICSGLGMIPYAGDLAKTGKSGKGDKSVHDAIILAGKSPQAMQLMRPGLEALGEILRTAEKFPINCDVFPDIIRRRIDDTMDHIVSIRRQIDAFLKASNGGKISRIDHARIRSKQGRPVGPVMNNAQRAGPKDVFVQPDDGRFVVRGPKGREHILEPDGEHVTSLVRENSTLVGRLRNGTIRRATEEKMPILNGLTK